MTPITLLACLTTQTATPAVLRAAGAVARRTAAHVTGLHTIAAIEIYPGIAVHIPGEAHEGFNCAQKDEAEAIEKQFEAFSDDDAFTVGWRLIQADSVSAADRMVESALTSDLVLIAQEAEDDRPDQRGAIEALIRQSGRPVIVVPRDWEGETLGQSLLVGWSATRESARAVHDAIAIAAPGAAVHILVAGSDEGTRSAEMDTAKQLAAKLDRLGFEANVIGEETPYRAIAAVLQDTAEEQGADLIVTGAFGHSRIYDFVLGAVTTELLQDLRFPVLFSK